MPSSVLLRTCIALLILTTLPDSRADWVWSKPVSLAMVDPWLDYSLISNCKGGAAAIWIERKYDYPEATKDQLMLSTFVNNAWSPAKMLAEAPENLLYEARADCSRQGTIAVAWRLGINPSPSRDGLTGSQIVIVKVDISSGEMESFKASGSPFTLSSTVIHEDGRVIILGVMNDNSDKPEVIEKSLINRAWTANRIMGPGRNPRLVKGTDDTIIAVWQNKIINAGESITSKFNQLLSEKLENGVWRRLEPIETEELDTGTLTEANVPILKSPRPGAYMLSFSSHTLYSPYRPHTYRLSGESWVRSNESSPSTYSERLFSADMGSNEIITQLSEISSDMPFIWPTMVIKQYSKGSWVDISPKSQSAWGNIIASPDNSVLHIWSDYWGRPSVFVSRFSNGAWQSPREIPNPSLNVNSGSLSANIKFSGTSTAFLYWFSNEAGEGYSFNVSVGRQSATSPKLSVIRSARGIVRSTPDGISCGYGENLCVGSFNSVTLTATPNPSYYLKKWIGCPAATGNTCSLTLNQKTTVGAFFAKLPKYALKIVKTQGGEITSDPAGLKCKANAKTCSTSFVSGTRVRLTPNPLSGYRFTGWTGACTGTAACEVTMDAKKLVGAQFE